MTNKSLDDDSFDVKGLTVPFRLCMLGPSGSGKTSQAEKMLLDKECLFGVFSAIVICSPHARKDKSFGKVDLDGPGMYVYPAYDDGIGKRIYEGQMALPATAMRHVLLFVDDQAHTTRDCPFLEKIAIGGRHAKISLIMCIHQINMADPTQRENMTNWMAWSAVNKDTMDALYKQCGNLLTKKQFREAFIQCCSRNFGFLHCRRRAKGGQMMLVDGLAGKILNLITQRP